MAELYLGTSISVIWGVLGRKEQWWGDGLCSWCNSSCTVWCVTSLIVVTKCLTVGNWRGEEFIWLTVLRVHGRDVTLAGVCMACTSTVKTETMVLVHHSLSPSYTVQDPSPWNGPTHTYTPTANVGLPSSINLL